MKNIENANSNLLLHVAALEDNFDAVEYLVSEGSIDINTKDNKGRIPLHLAATKGNVDITAYLVKRGANINAQDECGWTALHYAVYSGDIDTVKFLIDNGADYNITDNEGTPVFYAFQYGRIDLVRYFVEEKLIDPMMKINEYGGTLFDEATVGGNSDNNLNTIKYLIDERNVVYDGNDMLENAISHGYFKIAKYLIEEKGVDPNFAGENGWTLLHIAAERGDIEIVEHLLEKGADINAVAGGGTTVLHITSRCCDLKIVQCLIMEGANVNVRDNDGNTPLHLAAQDYEFQDKRYQLDVVKCLVNSGADVSAKNNDGKTVLDIADNSNVIQYLNSIDGGL